MNGLLQKLRAGQPAVGGWISFASSYVAELMAHAGYDWIGLDIEHGAIGIESAQAMLQAIATTPTSALVRLSGNDPVAIGRFLDAGAAGVIVAMVNTPEQARRVVQAARFPPAGRRSVGLGRWRLRTCPENPPAVNDQIAVVVMIEHVEAVRQADAILAVEGIDAFFIGPNDLSASAGYDRAEAERAIDEVLTIGKRRGVAAGIHVGSAEQAARRMEQGFQLVAVSEAGQILRAAAREQLSRLAGGSEPTAPQPPPTTPY